MSNGSAIPQSMAGDEVRLAISLIHEMNVVAVDAAFRHQTNENVQILLTDEVTSEPDRVPPGNRKSSEWLPSGQIGPQHIAGDYYLDRIFLTTATDRTIALRRNSFPPEIANLSIRVIDEPETLPQLQSVQFDRP